MSAEEDAINLDNERKKRRQRATTGGGGTEDKRPVVRIKSGQLHKMIDEAEDALLLADSGLYRQGQRVVRVVLDKIKTFEGDGYTLRLSVVTSPHLTECFTKAARFEKWDKRADDWITCNCPRDFAETYLARNGDWKLPVIQAVVNIPTFRPDGSLIDQAGYDVATGLLYDPMGVQFPPISDNPTRDEALAALDVLCEPITEFKFTDEASKSVFLVGAITATIRRSLPTAPMIFFNASTAGIGKSKLVDTCSMIATGERAAVTSTSDEYHSDVELEKKLSSSLLAGTSVISIDNISQPLKSNLLCQILTQIKVKIRIFGKLEEIDVPSNSTIFGTGNNAVVVGDLTRRTLVGSLEVEVERPELEEFEFDPVIMVKTRRPEFVHAVLTIVKAYGVSGHVSSKKPLGSFERWSAMVRDPLIWLGYADPIDVQEEVRQEDPILQNLKQMMTAWENAFIDKPQLLRDVIRTAEAIHGGDGAMATSRDYINVELREAVVSACGGERQMGALKLAGWLRRNKNRKVLGRKFVISSRGHDQVMWALEGKLSPVEVYDVDETANNDIPF